MSPYVLVDIWDVKWVINRATHSKTEQMMNHEEEVYATLKGEYKHYCPDWDMMAIDETCTEFSGCLCNKIRLQRMNNAVDGTCCSCGYSGEEETLCAEQADKIHCVHWWEGVPNVEGGNS